MLSAGGYLIVLYGPIHLPQIMPRDDALHAILRSAPHMACLPVLRNDPAACRGGAVSYPGTP
jgi:hypothetical protein